MFHHWLLSYQMKLRLHSSVKVVKEQPFYAAILIFILKIFPKLLLEWSLFRALPGSYFGYWIIVFLQIYKTSQNFLAKSASQIPSKKTFINIRPTIFYIQPLLIVEKESFISTIVIRKFWPISESSSATQKKFDKAYS